MTIFKSVAMLAVRTAISEYRKHDARQYLESGESVRYQAVTRPGHVVTVTDRYLRISYQGSSAKFAPSEFSYDVIREIDVEGIAGLTFVQVSGKGASYSLPEMHVGGSSLADRIASFHSGD